MSLTTARRLVAALPQRPADPDLEPIARELVRHAAPKRVKARSIAKACDHLVADRELRQRVRTMAQQLLEEELPMKEPLQDLPEPAWLPLEEAALLLVLPATWIHRALKYPQFRRMWGWPRCIDGRHWMFCRAAISGALVEIPEREPYHLLPSWCLRADHVDMQTIPEVD